jgi:16S rRNA (uracil1498-N3)-methyltransferase
LQPGDAITLFNDGPLWDDGLRTPGEFEAVVTRMGRSDVQVRVGAHHAVQREPHTSVHLAVGMPANERMDWLVEKATELGVASIQPLVTERSVLRLSAERADKKQAHWQSVAIAACEQCGGNRVPLVHAVRTLPTWLASLGAPDGAAPARLLLSLRTQSVGLRGMELSGRAALFLSGPEGGLSATEEDVALAQGFVCVSLGPRVLRAETAALAALTLLV